MEFIPMPNQDGYLLQSIQSIKYAFSIDMNAYILSNFLPSKCTIRMQKVIMTRL